MTEQFDSGLAPIVYRIDERDEIVFVNDAWRTFAKANGAVDLAQEATGSSLWSHVTGDETGMLWRELIARVRAGAAITLPYRCDAPGRRRHLSMTLRLIDGDGVEFTSSLDSAEARDPIALLASHYGTGSAIRSCSWCRRFDADGFVEVEEAIVRLGLLEQEARPITHTICPGCEGTVRAAAGI